MYDLIVIGGGPAGSAAAITAAQDGYRVLLLERGQYPRHKVCGEFVSSESLKLLASLLGTGYASLVQDALRIRSSRIFLDGRVLRTRVDPPAASITRIELDAALWRSAEHHGVEARQQVTVISVDGGGPFHVSSSAGKFASRAVIDASGRWSNLTARTSSNGDGGVKWLGIKAHFSEAFTGQTEPSVDLYFCDGGYCGVQPLRLPAAGADGEINVCAMVQASAATSLPEIFALHSALAERSRGWRPRMEAVSTSPLIFRDPAPNRGKVLAAGDAAAFIDPFVGDGISLALRSGSLAAECLLPFFRRLQELAPSADEYGRRYRERFFHAFHNASRIRRALRLPRPVRSMFLPLLEGAPRLTEYLVRKTR
jgi:flavin-dependent dehydrogenase